MDALAHISPLMLLLGHGVQAGGASGTIHRLRTAGAAVYVAQLLVEVGLQVAQLRRDLALEVLESCGHLLHHLRVTAGLAGGAWQAVASRGKP